MSTAMIRIAEVALSKAEKVVLDVVTRLLRKEEVCFQLSDVIQTSNVIIINTDDTEGQAVYARLPLDNPQQRVILISEQDADIPANVFVLTRPLRVQTLKDFLSGLYSKLVGVSATTQASPIFHSDVNAVSTPEKMTNTQQTHPAHSKLLDIFLEIQRHQSIVQVLCTSFPPLYINPQYKMVLTIMSEAEVYDMVSDASLHVDVAPLGASQYVEYIDKESNYHISLEKVMWCTALHSSHGEPISLALTNKALRLKAWPNFSKLSFDSEHMRLASLLSKAALTLTELENLTDASHDTVVGFCNAVYIMGLLELKDDIPEPKACTPLPEKIGVIERIASRLKLSMHFNHARVA